MGALLRVNTSNTLQPPPATALRVAFLFSKLLQTIVDKQEEEKRYGHPKDERKG